MIGSGAAVSNTVLVNGGALQATTLTLGTNGASYNSLVISNGGSVYDTGPVTIGFNASYNSALVATGGTWNLGGQTLTLGFGAATGNVLTISGDIQ